MFFNDYVLPGTDGLCPGYMSSLPAMFQQADHDSVLRLSVLAAATTSLAHKTTDRRLGTVAVAYYVASLQTLNSTLSNPHLEIGGELMTAVIVLGLYEVC